MKKGKFSVMFLMIFALTSCGGEKLENNKLAFDSSKITSMLIDQRDRKNYAQWKCKTEDSSAILNRVTYYESHQHDKKKQTPDVNQYWKRTSVYFRTNDLIFDFKVYYRDENSSYYFYQNQFFVTKDNLENFFEDYWKANWNPETKWSVTETHYRI